MPGNTDTFACPKYGTPGDVLITHGLPSPDRPEARCASEIASGGYVIASRRKAKEAGYGND